MKKLKYLLLLLVGVLSLCSFTTKSIDFVRPASLTCHDEVRTRQLNGELDYFHYNFLWQDGYYNLYWKMTKVTNQFNRFAALTEEEIQNYIDDYNTETNEMHQLVFDNLATRTEDLMAGQYVGLFWNSTFGDKEDNTSYLYLIWTSKYDLFKSITLKSVTVNGQKINMQTIDEVSDIYQFEDYNFDLHFSVIGGYQNGVPFGVLPASKYEISGFESGLRPEWAQYHGDYEHFESVQKINFNIGGLPEQHKKDVLFLVTQSYKIITDCEVQTHFSLNFGGYMHYAVFNTNIPIDKIYRVDVSYTVTNDNKDWWQGFLPDTEYNITKSLTAEKKSGGLFGLTDYQGFEQGSFQSTDSNAKNYKYRLHLNYDSDAWNIFAGESYNEANYKRVSDFKILRINYITDGSINEIPVDMDPVEGDSMLITDPDLIIDTETAYYDFKKMLDDIGRKISETIGQYKWAIYLILGALGVVLVLWILAKLKSILSILFGSNKGV